MAEFEEFPRETRRDPGVTHRDSDAPPPRPLPGSTHRDGSAPGDPLMRLPGVLAERFAVVGELPVQGAESDLLLVRDAAGAEFVVKVFRRGYSADREVWAKLPALDSEHVVRILETGHAGGRDYELTEYAPAGNLRALMTGPLPGETVTRIVAQLAAGLDRLHRAGIVHRDLKPENILVTGADPVRLAIADFGLSKVIEQSVVFASSSRTLAYAAPESLSGQVSPARDWWSLGMIVRELVTGRPPFLGMSETVVVDHLATRPIDNDDIADPRLRLLCRGLLTRDPRRRWTAAEITEWLDGGSPAVAHEPVREAVSPDTGSGLPFGGRRFTDRAELARALIERWDEAARYFFARGEAGEAWRALREWLSGLPDDTRIELVDAYLSTQLPPDVKLLHLVRWLDPALPPHYLGRRVAAADLPALAALAGEPGHPDHRTACLIGRAFWEQRLLPELASFGGGADLARGGGSGDLADGGGGGDLAGRGGGDDLARIDGQWRAHVTEWNRLAEWLRGGPQSRQAGTVRLPNAGSPLDDPPVVLLTLLALAARPAETGRLLADAAARARTSVREPVPWFEQLAAGAGDDPLRLLAVVRVAPDAVLAAEAGARDRQVAQQQAEGRRRQWAMREQQRLAGRGNAVMRAVLWSLPLLAVWLLLSWMIGSLFAGGGKEGTQAVGGLQRSNGVPIGLLLLVAVLAWAVQCGAEVLLARTQGKDYLPYGPWSWLSKVMGAGGRGLSKASQVMSASAQNTGRRGCGLLLLAGTVPLLLILLLLAALTPVAGLLWLLILVVAAGAHAVAAGVRLHQWRQHHQQAEREALA